MKKYLSALLICASACGAAFADEPNVCFASRGTSGNLTYDYIVYFKHDYPKSTRQFCTNNAPVNASGCCDTVETRQVGGKTMCCPDSNDAQCYSPVFAELAEDLTNGSEQCAHNLTETLNNVSTDGDVRILLLATTDKTGSHSYNDALSNRRLKIVKQLFGPAHQDKIITHLAGETNDNFTGTTGRNQNERTVRIFISNSQEIEQIVQTVSGAAMVENTTKVTLVKGNAQTSAQRIRNIAKNLRGLTGNLDTSVWKNKDGNFNTARLASDSIAGVVLGTAGGLITSNIIKKNQIKGGFEDVKCTVGGQVVAEYGDDFMVGMR